MVTQADHNIMGSLSKQHEKTRMADSTGHFQGFEMFKFHNFPGEHPCRIFRRLRHKEHRTLVPLLHSPASVSLFGNLRRLESSGGFKWWIMLSTG